jgi:tetratricopeptide (TPR) repeat protein
MSQKISNIREKARNATLAKNFAKGMTLYQKVLKIDPNDEEALLNVGLIYELVGDRDNFIKHSADTFHRFSDNPKFITRMAAAEFKLGNFLSSYERLKNLKLEQLNFDALMTVCAASAALGREGESTLYALEAIKLRPSDPLAHSNLGGGFMSLGKLEEARICFETALLLDPDNGQANTNMGVILSKQRKYDEAILYAEKALNIYEKINNIDEIDKIKFHLSLGYLQLGDMEKGWNYYDNGLNIKDTSGRWPHRVFPVPQWKGEDIAEKTILVWREQGIGDELMFYSAINYLSQKSAKIIIECDHRLQSILQRSFPLCVVRPARLGEDLNNALHDYDYHCPIGSVYGIVFPTKESYAGIKPYLKPDKKRVEFYDQRLGDPSKTLRVGISWRSGLLTPLRNMYHTSLIDWAAVFKIKNVQFINLQYGDTNDEVTFAQKTFDVSLNNWTDINRKDDFDDMAALISNLDVVVTTGSATFHLAGILGIKTLLMVYEPSPYQFGLSGGYYQYPNTEVFCPDIGSEVSTLLEEIIPQRIKILQSLKLDKPE